MKGYLLVRVAGKAYGLPVGRVLEVGDATEVFDVPRKVPGPDGCARGIGSQRPPGGVRSR